MTPAQFSELAAQGYNRIPVTRRIMADLDTPLSAYLKLADGPYSFLFESVQGGEKWGRYSFIGLPCRKILKVYGHQITIEVDGDIVESFEHDDPLEYVKEFQSQYRVPPQEDTPRFMGGLVGYFGYDTVRYIEPRLRNSQPPDALGTPDILLMVAEQVLVFDNLAGTLTLVYHIDPSQENSYELAMSQLDDLARRLNSVAVELTGIDLGLAQPDIDQPSSTEPEYEANFTQVEYEAIVERIKEYIRAGDVMQVVPSQRMALKFDAPPISLYRALRHLNPSPYMYYLNLDGFHIVGSSPEILARSEQGTVTSRPLAGTRKRGIDEASDIALEKELLADPKEIAEHLMLIDLGRNDVGRVSEIGSVEVTEQMKIERYSHVMHIVSNVTGKLKSGLGAIDVLRAALPAGTLSGAPKIRAMEIIDEVEPVKRGIYGGAVGYIAWDDDMDLAIAIRTAVIKDQVLYLQAGGGVVADSVPQLEWEETHSKARALFRAAAVASGGATRTRDEG